MTELTGDEKAAWKCPSCGDGLWANGCMSCAHKRSVPAESAPASTEGEYPDPSSSDLERPEFEAVWQAIKGWDIQRSAGQGYAGATGNDVMRILNALAGARGAESAPAPAVSPWEALLQWSRDQDPEHAGNGPFISLQHEGDEFDKPASVGVVDGSASGEGKTANEAARDLCAKLGIEMAPAPTEGVGGVRVERRHREEADGLVYRLAHPLDSTGAEAARQANRTLLTQALAAAEARGAENVVSESLEELAIKTRDAARYERERDEALHELAEARGAASATAPTESDLAARLDAAHKLHWEARQLLRRLIVRIQSRERDPGLMMMDRDAAAANDYLARTHEPASILRAADHGAASAIEQQGTAVCAASCWPVRPVVRWFAEQMEAALRRNDHKGGWHKDVPSGLLQRIDEESLELLEAMDNDDSGGVVREAADVANMAMMVADHFREGGPDTNQGRGAASAIGRAGESETWRLARDCVPEVEVEVLVYYELGLGSGTVVAKRVHGSGRWYSSCFPIHDEDIVAWTPLPAPPNPPPADPKEQP